jgi:predicted DNA-binding transcriptional regulator AlpA
MELMMIDIKTDCLPKELQDRRILSAVQAAKLLGVSIATFRRLDRAGKFPRVQIGDRRLGWKVAEIEKFINNSTKKEG